MNVRPESNTSSSPASRPPGEEYGAGEGSASAEGRAQSRRARSLSHVHPADVTLSDALTALADPVRRTIVRELAGGPDWTRACGTFDLPVTKATRSHHFAVLRQSGVVEQRDAGSRRLNRLRRPEFDAAFPGLLDLVLSEEPAPGI
ncbi:helix-turn-helix domain-containing protein [Streptomyces sp. NRRL B-1677]|uniref:Transcriptional regulator n=1 Tax=Streptomyces klenkii TaxID=1420899 RepID=A0A3B0AUP2_9ACTN|nr:helix-turn-helix domain-containing protein [Streptomyces sp. NRRL B-1677]RKN64259.1 transcriptional regulator [Streptomyces klenkii]